MLKIVAIFFCLLCLACVNGGKKQKELTGPHAEIQLFITNSFSTGISGNDSLHIYPIPKNKSVNNFYSVLLQSDTLLKKTLIKLGKKGTEGEIESIRENLKFFTIEETTILQIELYFEEEKFACTFLDTLVETFNEDVMKQLYEESRRKVKLITDQIDSVAVILHDVADLMMEDREILNLEKEEEAYFEFYIETEKNRNYLKKIKDCLSQDFEKCLTEYATHHSTEFNYLNEAMKNLYNLQAEKTQQDCDARNGAACKEIDKKINKLKTHLDTYLKNSIAAHDAQIENVESRMKTLPKTKHDLMREYEINQKLYTFLLEKKTEMMIGMAGFFSPISLVDRARWNGQKQK